MAVFIELFAALSIVIGLNLLSSVPVCANVSVPPVFGDHMVLQRNQNVEIWGKADAGEAVQVSIGAQTKKAVTNKDGNWNVSLDPMPAGRARKLSIQGKNKLLIDDIEIGDVWLFSGQSNVLWPLRYSDATANDTKNIDRLSLRVYTTSEHKPDPKENGCDSGHRWRVITKDSLNDLHVPAIPVLFARGLQQSEGIPIGVLMAAKGAVPIETFLPPKTVRKMEERHFKPALMPPGVKPGDNYTALIEPLLKFRISGIVWYQGEGNYQTAATYRELFPWFIEDWRLAIEKVGNRTQIPFYFIQIPNHGTREAALSDSFWADLRESQTAALKLKNVYMVTTIDTIVTEPAPLHSKEKREIASRLLNLVRATKYGASLKAQGPIYRNFKRNGKCLSVALDRADAELVIKNGTTVRGFQLAGKDKVFHRANGAIVGKRIQISSSAVAEPVALRYAWEDNPVCSIYCNGLPLSPFRTDDWVTHPKLNASDWPTLPTSKPSTKGLTQPKVQ